MDDTERDRIELIFYPRPPEDVIAGAARRGLNAPAEQTWVRSEGLHVERPLRLPQRNPERQPRRRR
jgi:hypothetical protein